jgi:hypothetical protein
MSLKAKLLIACLILVLTTAGGGYFAWQLQQELGARAIGIYDSAVIGVSHIAKAQAEFIRYEASPSTGMERLTKILVFSGDRARTGGERSCP